MSTPESPEPTFEKRVMDQLAAENLENDAMLDACREAAKLAGAEGRLADERRLFSAIERRQDGQSAAYPYSALWRVCVDRGSKIVNDEKSVVRWREDPKQRYCAVCGASRGAACLMARG